MREGVKVCKVRGERGRVCKGWGDGVHSRGVILMASRGV